MGNRSGWKSAEYERCSYNLDMQPESEKPRQQVRRRVSIEVPVLDTGSGARLGRIFDLTEEGFMLLTAEEFEANTLRHLTLCLPEPHNWQMQLAAECMWAADSNFSQLRGVGFCIARISDNDRLLLREFLLDF